MNSKPWYQSSGIIGPIVALVAQLISDFGKNVGIEVDQNQVTDALLQLVVLAGIIVGIVGRWRATTKIKPIRRKSDAAKQGNIG